MDTSILTEALSRGTLGMRGRSSDGRLVGNPRRSNFVGMLDVIGGLAFGQIARLVALSGGREASNGRRGWMWPGRVM